MNIKTVTLALCVFTLLINCALENNNIIGGSGTNAGNPAVIGTVIFCTNSPVDGAEVYIRSQQFIKDTMKNDLQRIPDAITDSLGKFKINSIDTGSYNFEINYQNTYVKRKEYFRYTRNLLDTLGSIKLVQAGGFYGFIERRNIPRHLNIFVQLRGIDRITKTDQHGKFRFNGLAPGDYNIRILTSDEKFGILDHGDTISVQAGEYKDIGKIRMPFEFWKDTVIIRQILDTNGLYNVPVSDVVKRYHDRIFELILINRKITVLPDIIGDLRIKDIKLIDNPIETIPDELGKIYTLHRLTIKGTLIETIPGTIGDLPNIRHLDLSNNEMNNLPDNITNLSMLKFLSVNNNRLKQAPRSIKNWINTYSFDPDWAKTQRNL